MPDRTKIFGTAASVAVTAALSACSASAGTPPSQPAPASAADNDHSGPARDSRSDYADGQYSAEGKYGGLPSSIGVTITLADDIVTAVSVTPHATDPTSLDLQKRFAAAVPAVVVGRDIDEIEVDRLAGSSGTPQGFNAAVEDIKAQAN
jgi:uncharacterized protein with FMN-binding domain